MKLLITGAGGYIGSIATYLFLQKGYEVVAVDNFSTGYQQPLELLHKQFGKKQLHFYQADISNDIGAILDKETGIQAVIHYAANCSVDESMQNPYQYFTNNTCSSNDLLAAMLQHNINTIIFSSTCAVYGKSQYIPFDENHPTNPTNPYGESKQMTETMIQWYGKLKNIRYVILRYFNVCGASDDGRYGDSKKPSIHLVQNAVRGALGIESFYVTCPEVDTPDKTPIRDYVNVVDLNDAHSMALEYLARGGKSEIINLGTGNGNSVLEIIQKIQEVTGTKLELKKAERSRLGEYPIMIASIEKAQRILGWKPQRTLERSVESLIRWYKSYPRGWEK